jgi:lysophospholipase L1-like esterase
MAFETQHCNNKKHKKRLFNMRLDASQLNKIIHNVLSYSYDENDRLHFHRFSEMQRQTYTQESQEWIAKAKASASATFDFITDSDFIRLNFDLICSSSQKFCSVDLYVDGVFYSKRYIEDFGIKLAGFELPAGQHRVTVYFPWSAQTVVNEVRLSDGASIIPVEKNFKMLCFGDSITQGYTSKFTSMSYVNQTARTLNAEVVNQGIGGYYFNEATIDESILFYNPDLITVAYGTNDYSLCETVEEFTACASSYIKKLSELFPDTKILGILPIYRNDQNHYVRSMGRRYSIDDARAILKRLYENCPNGYVLEETGIPHIPEAYVADFLHPNDFGFSLMAQGITRKIQEILK